MKIRKVEIQAFRAYDELKDCTFDFTREDGQTADFISIYAPNGFGKTSFYDAVEWGFTNNIYRFTRQDHIKEYAHDEKQLKYELANKKSPHYILRNKNSPSHRSSFVRLHFLTGNTTYERLLKPTSRVDSSDYSFDEKVTEKPYFRDVILSQDNIDAFLNEDDPIVRYTKFMRFFGDNDLNRVYTNVLCLITLNHSKISSLEDEIENLEFTLPQNIDNQILEKINLRINELVAQGEVISLIIPTFNEKDFVEFSNTISERRRTIQNEMSDINEQLKNVQQQYSRFDEISIIKKVIEANELKLKTSLELQINFEKLSKMRNRQSQITKAIAATSSEHRQAKDVETKFPIYLTIVENINQQMLETNKQKKQLIDNENEINVTLKRLAEAKSAMNKLNSSLFNLRQRNTEFPLLEKLVSQAESDIARAKKDLENLTLDINGNERLLQDLVEQQTIFEMFLQQLGKNNFSDQQFSDEFISDHLIFIRQQEQEIRQHNVALKTLEKEIESYTSLNNELKQLIFLSSNYVAKAQINTCPVCLQHYDSFEILSERILQNPLLSESIQIKLVEKNNLNTTITNTVDEVSKRKQEIIKNVTNNLQKIKIEIAKYSQNSSQLSITRNQFNLQLKSAEEIIKGVFVEIQGNTIDEYKNQLIKTIQAEEKLTSDATQKVIVLETNLSALKATVESAKRTIADIEKSVKISKLKEDFLNVDEFLTKKGQSKDFSLETASRIVTEQSKKLADLILDETQLAEEIKSLSLQLINYNEIDLELDVKNTQDTLIQNRAQVQLFDGFITTVLHTLVSHKNLGNKEAFEEAERNLRGQITRRQKLSEEYEKIDDFKNNVMPFLRFKISETQIKESKKELLFLKDTVNSTLQREKERLSALIDSQVQSFFYEDLINQLYRKIDPHPEYKRIKFKCDFAGDKPKLNVFVSDMEETFIIPNLYFSTAQMNILSLTIFLAKALNAQDEMGNAIDCIFIDDPIQSLDSINILSTIDLIRSIVYNFKKQIVLSTHDENFFNLLQKKMPPDVFNSKYLELETFGKVKRD